MRNTWNSSRFSLSRSPAGSTGELRLRPTTAGVGKPHLAWKSTQVPALKLSQESTSDFDPLAASGRDQRLQRLEAILLMSREPLNSRKLSQFANLADGTEARTLLRRLNEWYDKVGRSFRVEEVAGGFQLLSRKKFSPWLQRLAHIPSQTRLSAPALETLAVIAYRQPVLRADIEAIRGVNCGEILRQLMERDLVRIGGRSEELGRPYLYCTTRRFLNLFGLVSLEELPRSAELRELPLENFAGPLPQPVLEADSAPETSPEGEGESSEFSDDLDPAGEIGEV